MPESFRGYGTNEYQRRAYERPLIGDGAPDVDSGYYRHRETRRGVAVTVMVVDSQPTLER